MKEPVDIRQPLGCGQYQFDGAPFSPQNLEDTLVVLINTLFNKDIKAVSSLDFKEDTDISNPIIVVSSQDLVLSKTERGVRSIGYGPEDNSIHSEQVANGTIDLNLVSRSARGTTLYSYELLELFQELGYFMNELIGVMSFYPDRLIAPKKIEDNEHLWKSTVRCSYRIARSWATERLAPKLKTFGVNGLVNTNEAV